ncbi:hypothetical protein DICPUDRAFT_51633, partial [Dictyostelium purpureum]
MNKIIVLFIYFFLFLNFLKTNCLKQDGCHHALNDRPVIGILSQPASSDKYKEYGYQYIAASYVKYVESAGARVVPILYDQDEDTLRKLLNSINGILLPGGGVYFDEQPIYNKSLYLIWNYVIESNKRGDYFPLWGTCLGFEEIVSVAANTFDVLTSFNASNYSIPLNLTDQVLNLSSNSLLFKEMPLEMLKTISNEPITMNNHRMGLSVETFNNFTSLHQFFDILSLNDDKSGNTFISVIESKEYPIYAVMFHPEKPLFEWYEKEDI